MLKNLQPSISCGISNVCLQKLWFNSYTFPRNPTHGPMNFREGPRKMIYAPSTSRLGIVLKSPIAHFYGGLWSLSLLCVIYFVLLIL